MIVVDASVVVDYLRGPGSPAFRRLTEAFVGGATVGAPHLVDVEVAQAIRRLVSAGTVDSTGAATMLSDLMAFPVVRYVHLPLLRRAFELRHNVTIYDGMYLALAERLDCTLVTGDSSLDGVPGCDAAVELVATPA